MAFGFGAGGLNINPMTMAGLSMMAGGTSLNDLPNIMLKMQAEREDQRRHKEQMELQRKNYELSKLRFEDDRERTRLLKGQEDRENKKTEDKAKFGEIFKKYDLDPKMTTGKNIDLNESWGTAPKNITDRLGPEGEEPGAPTTTPGATAAERFKTAYANNAGKSDAMMPIQEAGNPMTQSIMDLPLSVRQGLSNAPQTASDVFAPVLQKKMETDIAPPAGTDPFESLNLKMPDGTTRTFNTRNPRDRLLAESAMRQGATQVNAPTPQNLAPKLSTYMRPDGSGKLTLDENKPEDQARIRAEGLIAAPNRVIQETSPDNQINQIFNNRVAKDQEAALNLKENYYKRKLLGGLAIGSGYTGPGGDEVAAAVKVGQALWPGFMKDYDVSKAENAQVVQHEMALALKQELLKDPQMNTGERKMLEHMTQGLETSPQGIARGLALAQAKVEYADAKLEEIYALQDQGLTSRQAYQQASKNDGEQFNKYFSEDNIKAHMDEFMKTRENPKNAMQMLEQTMQEGEGLAGVGGGGWTEDKEKRLQELEQKYNAPK